MRAAPGSDLIASLQREIAKNRRMNLLDYKLMRYAGIALMSVGGMALYFDVLAPGTLAIGTGALIILASVVGAWWNDG